MAYRKVNSTKKYKGIFEYYNPKDKITRGYYLSYRDEFGKSTMINLKADNKEDALAKANEKRKEVADKIKAFKEDSGILERAIKNKKLSLNQLAKIFFENRKAANNTKDIRVYDTRIAPHIGDFPLTKITTQHIQDLPLEKFAPKTQNSTIDLLSVMFNYAIKQELHNTNPISRDAQSKNYIPKMTVSTETGRVLNDDELELLWHTLKATNPRLHLYCKFLYYTGARPDAIISLQVKHYNPIKHSIMLKAMKLASDYSQPLKDEVETLLLEWIDLHDLKYDEYIFYPTQPTDKTKHTRYEALRKSARPIFDKLFNEGLPVNAKMRRASFYSLRRTAATKIYKSKGLAHASKFLHHSDVRTTMKYLSIDENMAEAIHDAL